MVSGSWRRYSTTLFGAQAEELPPTAGVLSLPIATAAKGYPHTAAGLFVWHAGGSRAAIFALPVRGDAPAYPQSRRRDYARPMYPGIRMCHRKDGVFVAISPGADLAVGLPANWRRSCGGDEPAANP